MDGDHRSLSGCSSLRKSQLVSLLSMQLNQSKFYYPLKNFCMYCTDCEARF